MATNSNPPHGRHAGRGDLVRVSHQPPRAERVAELERHHKQINGRKMDGFVTSVVATQPMGYHAGGVLPFEYALASTFTLANRWFCPVPCPTYPNRRFLLTGTASSDITTSIDTLTDPPPPGSAIFDRLDAHGIAGTTTSPTSRRRRSSRRSS